MEIDLSNKNSGDNSSKENDNERKEYLLNLLKNGIQISNREREELMFKFKINDISIFRPKTTTTTTVTTPTNNNRGEILNKTTEKLSNLEINTTSTNTTTTKDDYEENDSSKIKENKSSTILKKYQYRNMDEDDSVGKPSNYIINTADQDESQNLDNDGDEKIDSEGQGGDQKNNIASKTKTTKTEIKKHDYVCENCNWCDGFEADSKNDCINCKCSLIHHISTVNQDEDDQDDDYFDSDDDEDDYNNNNNNDGDN